MEEETVKVLPTSSSHRGSRKMSQSSDIRNLWTTATLSQPQLNIELSQVCENFDEEGREIGKTRGWYTQKSSWEGEEDKTNLNPEELNEHTLLELELHRGGSSGTVRSHFEEERVESKNEAEKASSLSSLSISKHAPHRAYWAEQQNRLPLPLMELMENEVLEILTKALRSYRSDIGRNHFLTKELQRYIEVLKKRRNKRLHVSAN
ncbi:cation channel sperm-associated protein subunit zeta isoform X2 [Tupaia chinensis]|uniref:cation channel sperm-associated protein subunit zeta isoform X2 n=1 Tax=Tupaia chinensis TaxID=246437 RepID=UPI0003C915A0|nr:cation channel sperm-associated protein subunit zeta isoform X2 [Tupaia chinensis]